ncbi:hypothetical protein HBI46_123560 [Parastagonospora nodorum]|nr:hypothetical protein HBH61_130660 [Parastagonospora nodorum]KAH5416683.1 hypothetical protein HBI46_123560 [Parastagonospora nodorum]KAH5654370.1 hypothetical protein HBI51_055950 [Parastagonospora nodorum]KAH6303053.1 hypothetical protein HBI39_120560 [Parastagonospora nodorum]
MFSRAMRHAVLQATALFILSKLFSHYKSDGMFDAVVQNEGWQNMRNALEAETNRTTAQPTLGAGNATDKSAPHYQINETSGWTASKGTISPIEYPPEESFYWRRFPRDIVVYMILAAMQYWWYIALEKMLPARPRYKDVVPSAKFEESEDREEEVVKKWIAQGRVNRASLNWGNTFLKWTLDMTIGRVWHRTVYHVLTWLLKLQHPKKLLPNLISLVTYSVAGDFLSPLPLVDLIAFVTIPTHHRIVFMAGVDLITNIFFFTIVRVFAAWAVKTDYAQMVMRNMTENAVNSRLKEEKLRRLGDEL